MTWSRPSFVSQTCFALDFPCVLFVFQLTFMIKMKNVDEMLLTVHEQFGYVNTHYHLDGRKTPIIEWLNPNYYRVIRIDVE